MGGILGGLFGRNKNVKPDYTGLQIQTSSAQMPIPIVWGTTKISHNVLFYNNFQAHKGGSKSGKGGIGGGGSSSQITTYTADLALGLCEGPIGGIGWVWDDRALSSPFALDFFVLHGTYPTATEWSYFAALYPTYALSFPGTAVAVGADVPLGSAASIGNIQWEVHGFFAGTGANGVDADPALVIQDFLVNPQYGAGFDPSLIDTDSLFAIDTSLQAYCRATGLSISPALVSQEQASTVLARWLQIINCAAVWSGGVLRFVPYGDTPIVAGTVQVTTTPMTIPPTGELGWQIGGGTGLTTTPLTYTWLVLTPPGGNLHIISIRYATAYYGIQMVDVGAAFPFFLQADLPGFYGVLGNTVYFSAADANQAIIITYRYTTQAGYTPNVTAIYSLGEDDYIDDGGDDVDPITASRVDPFSLHTIVRLDCMSRSNRYSPVPVEARDQSQIEIYGPRVESSIQAHEICDELNVGPISAQLILQRQLYIRANFKFKLGWQFCLLDPMDIIAITDAALGLIAYPVRIVSIDEDDNGLLDVVAEEFSVGIGSTPLYHVDTITTPPFNPNATVGNINPPLIYEPPASYSGGATELLLGCSASGPLGGADPNWGGANVWASLDGDSYAQVGTITGAIAQGYLTASIGSATGWDATNTLSIDLSESGGVLASVSEATAQAGVTLCVVDNELLAFETATLTAPNAYDLTGMQRGLYGTTPSSHASGVPFAYLGNASVILADVLPAAAIGKTIWFKFQSVNIFGNAAELLSDCVAYIFNGAAPGVLHPIAVQLQSGLPVDLGLVTATATIADDFGPVTQPVDGSIDLGAIYAGDPIATELLAGSPVDLGAITSSVTVYDDFGAAVDAVAQVIDLGSAP